jgi:hypothetical protein
VARGLAPVGLRSSPKPSTLLRPTAVPGFTTAAPPNGGKPPRHKTAQVSYIPVAVTRVARIMVQDIADVFGVIEQRGFDSPKAQ